MYKDNNWIIIVSLVGAAVLMVFSPVLIFGSAWIGGWILKVCVGQAIADGMNLMFDTTRFTPDFIPLACATLATIGKYFKSTRINFDKKNERR